MPAASDRHVFFTSATRGYLSKVQILAASLKRHNPEAEFVLALLDDVHGLPDCIAADPAIDRVLGADEILRGMPPGWIFQHSIVEACTAIKGGVLRRLLSGPGAATVTYLDPDIQVFGSFDALLGEHASHSIILTPHITTPESDLKGVLDNEVSALRHGAFNLGFVSVRNDAVGSAFADWWASRLRDLCVDDLAGGLFTDQKWIDLVPGLFDRVGINRDPGLNVSTWNLSGRSVVRDDAGGLRVNGEPLVFAHFSGFDSGNHAVALAPYVGDQPVFVELSHAYAAAMAAADDAIGAQPDWVFSAFADGTPIPAAARRRYALDPDLRRRVPDPFSATADELLGRSDSGAAFIEPSASGNVKLERLHAYLTGHTHQRTSDFQRSGIDDVDEGSSTYALWAPHDLEALAAATDNGRDTIAMFAVSSGGCAAHVDQLTQLLLPAVNVLQFRFSCEEHGSRPHLRVALSGAAGVPTAHIPIDAAADIVPAALDRCGVSFVHVHHRFGIEGLLEHFAEAFAGRYGVTLHDYAWISPEPHLAAPSGRYAGIPTAFSLKMLTEAAEPYLATGVHDVESPVQHAAFLRAAAFVIAPSRDCADRYREVVSGLDVSVHPHWEPAGFPVTSESGPRPALPPSGHMLDVASPVRVVIPGEFMPTKGSLVVLDVARLAARSDIDCTFCVLGAEAPDDAETPPNLEFRGRYRADRLGDEVRYAHGTVGWLPAQVPETYSYTASELMRSGLPLVVSDLGALPERVRPYPSHIAMRWDAHPREWLAALLEAHGYPNAFDVADEVTPGRSPFYEQEYLALVGAPTSSS